MTTLVDFWDSEVKIYTPASKAAQTALEAAMVALDGARASSADAVKALAITKNSIDALKRKMAGDASPADADADAKTLRSLIAHERSQAGTVVHLSDAEFEAQVALDAAKAQLATSKEKLAAATTALAEATAKSAKFAAWTIALGAAPLSTLQTDAHNAVIATAAGTLRGDALARITNDFPDPLKTTADARRTLQNQRLAHLADAVTDTELLLVTALKTHAHTPDAVDAARIDYTNAWNALASYVRTAKEDFDRALALYASVSSAPPLTPDELADIKTGPSRTAGEAALKPAEDDRDKALSAVYEDRYKLEKVIVTTLMPDPTAPLPTLTEQQTLDTAKSNLADKEKTFSGGTTHPTPKESLDAWEAALPDPAYRLLLAFQEADEILTRLSGVKPSDLQKAVTDDDAALAAALADATKASRTTEYLRSIRTQQSQRLDHAREVRQDRLFSYVRGDT
jgi:hypothetical protein